MIRIRTRNAFTLIELMAVAVLFAAVVAMVTVRLDAFSDQAALQSACGEVAATAGRLHTLALSDGLPHVVSCRVGDSGCSVRNLRLVGDRLTWSEPQWIVWPRGVTTSACAVNGEVTTSYAEPMTCELRIASTGAGNALALLLAKSSLRRGVVVDDGSGPAVEFAEPGTSAADLLAVVRDPDACRGVP